MTIENTTISFVKMFEGKLTSQYCEASGTALIHRAVADYMHSYLLYALTKVILRFISNFLRTTI